MIIQKVPHYVDSVLTQEVASAALQGGDVVVAWYTNQVNSQSVVHSHPYYELILPVAGSSVRYSVGGSVYDLHLGELILFPGEMYHSCKFNITADTSERLVVQIAPGIWDRAWQQSGLPRRAWNRDPIILDANAVLHWDFRGLLERMAQTVSLDERIRPIVQCCEVTELILLASHVITRRNAAPPPSATSLLIAKAVDYLQTHYTDPGLTVAQLAKPGASVPRVQGVHAGKRTRLPDQPADAALPQRHCGRGQRAGRLQCQRLYKLQQFFKEFPRAVRRYPNRVPRPAAAKPGPQLALHWRQIGVYLAYYCKGGHTA